jgi:hypothetical protein
MNTNAKTYAEMQAEAKLIHPQARATLVEGQWEITIPTEFGDKLDEAAIAGTPAAKAYHEMEPGTGETVLERFARKSGEYDQPWDFIAAFYNIEVEYHPTWVERVRAALMAAGFPDTSVPGHEPIAEADRPRYHEVFDAAAKAVDDEFDARKRELRKRFYPPN